MKQLVGRVWIFDDDVSTDLLMPGSVLADPSLDPVVAAKECMRAARPGWAEQVQPGDILVAGRNFGCGSSRPAQRMLRTLGIAAVVAESMSRLFFRACVNTGFPVLLCAGVVDAFEEGDLAEVDVVAGTVRNRGSGIRVQGEGLAPGTPPYEILELGGLGALLEQRVRDGAGR